MFEPTASSADYIFIEHSMLSAMTGERLAAENSNAVDWDGIKL